MNKSIYVQVNTGALPKIPSWKVLCDTFRIRSCFTVLIFLFCNHGSCWFIKLGCDLFFSVCDLLTRVCYYLANNFRICRYF